MTYRAIPRHLALDVAGDAETHAVDVVHLEDLWHALHVPMASGACVGAKRLDVPLMGEMRVAGEIVHPHPFNGFLVGPRLPELLDLCLVGAVPPPNHQVASHTCLYRRYSRFGRHFHR